MEEWDAMLAQLKFYESIVQNMAEGVAAENAEGDLVFINPAAACMLGYTPEEMVGMHWTTIIPADQQEIVHKADQRRQQGQTDRYELGLVCKDGERIIVQVSA